MGERGGGGGGLSKRKKNVSLYGVTAVDNVVWVGSHGGSEEEHRGPQAGSLWGRAAVSGKKKGSGKA